MACYEVTKESRIHHEDGWFYQFTDDGEGCIEISYYELIGNTETKQGSSFSIPKNCIETFTRVLGQME
jgi:hypothetical protein